MHTGRSLLFPKYIFTQEVQADDLLGFNANTGRRSRRNPVSSEGIRVVHCELQGSPSSMAKRWILVGHCEVPSSSLSKEPTLTLKPEGEAQTVPMLNVRVMLGVSVHCWRKSADCWLVVPVGVQTLLSPFVRHLLRRRIDNTSKS